MASDFTSVLWDMDGTIVDASEGILRRLTVTLEHFGRQAPTHDELIHWIGPTQYESFQKQAGMTADEATQAVQYYRTVASAHGYTDGAKLFAGVGEIIADLHAAGVPQAIASSKPEDQVLVLLDHFELAQHFTAVTGATQDERTLARKADIVAESLRRLAAAGADVHRPVLVGDRHHDVEGGAEQGVPVVFVTWGFSEPAEADGAYAVAHDPAELRTILGV